MEIRKTNDLITQRQSARKEYFQTQRNTTAETEKAQNKASTDATKAKDTVEINGKDVTPQKSAKTEKTYNKDRIGQAQQERDLRMQKDNSIAQKREKALSEFQEANKTRLMSQLQTGITA